MISFGIIEVIILFILLFVIYWLITIPTKKPVESLSKTDKGDIDDMISNINKAITDIKFEMEWEYIGVKPFELLDLFRRIEKCEIHVAHYIYKTEGDFYDVFFRFKKEDTERFKTEILGG